MSDNLIEEKKNSQETEPSYKEYSEFTNKFAEFAHGYIHDNIARVDQKSTTIFSFLLFTYLFILNPTYKWSEKSLLEFLQVDSYLVKTLILLMIISFASSIILAFLTVFPRLKVESYGGDDSSNLLYWESILKNFTPTKYIDNFKTKTPDDFVQIKLAHCYEIALVCKKKHKSLRYTMLTAISGVVLFLLVQLGIAFSPESFGISSKASQQNHLNLQGISK